MTRFASARCTNNHRSYFAVDAPNAPLVGCLEDAVVVGFIAPCPYCADGVIVGTVREVPDHVV